MRFGQFMWSLIFQRIDLAGLVLKFSWILISGEIGSYRGVLINHNAFTSSLPELDL